MDPWKSSSDFEKVCSLSMLLMKQLLFFFYSLLCLPFYHLVFFFFNFVTLPTQFCHMYVCQNIVSQERKLQCWRSIPEISGGGTIFYFLLPHQNIFPHYLVVIMWKKHSTDDSINFIELCKYRTFYIWNQLASLREKFLNLKVSRSFHKSSFVFQCLSSCANTFEINYLLPLICLVPSCTPSKLDSASKGVDIALT